MAFGKRKEEEIIEEETKIWECSSEDCKCWVRDNFKSSDSPICPICGSPMQLSSKVLQVVENPHRSY
ncbi:cold-inducible protein YdjO-related protein [Bacillus sp. 2205SS5-2]|uniref:cold-inducible protein YdjO-related protein n=1 Tax=Bacillus sp. 2205SS5-2 TaxID=3109031 RepID=UPI003007A230